MAIGFKPQSQKCNWLLKGSDIIEKYKGDDMIAKKNASVFWSPAGYDADPWIVHEGEVYG